MSSHPETSPYCPSCGKRILIGEHTCAGCGHPLPQQTATVFAYEDQSYHEYAGFWRRVGAYLIDSILLAIIGFMLGFGGSILGVWLGWSADKVQSLINVVSIPLTWLYFALMESSSSQGTLGKLAMGIQVTDLYGEPIGFGRATGRHFAKVLSALILLIGYIMAGFTEKKQALHDIMAGTLVVRR